MRVVGVLRMCAPCRCVVLHTMVHSFSMETPLYNNSAYTNRIPRMHAHTQIQEEYKQSRKEGGRAQWSCIVFVKTKLNAFAVTKVLQKLPALKATPSTLLVGLGSDIKTLDITPEVCLLLGGVCFCVQSKWSTWSTCWRTDFLELDLIPCVDYAQPPCITMHNTGAAQDTAAVSPGCVFVLGVHLGGRGGPRPAELSGTPPWFCSVYSFQCSCNMSSAV